MNWKWFCGFETIAWDLWGRRWWLVFYRAVSKKSNWLELVVARTFHEGSHHARDKTLRQCRYRLRSPLVARLSWQSHRPQLDIMGPDRKNWCRLLHAYGLRILIEQNLRGTFTNLWCYYLLLIAGRRSTNTRLQQVHLWCWRRISTLKATWGTCAPVSYLVYIFNCFLITCLRESRMTRTGRSHTIVI